MVRTQGWDARWLVAPIDVEFVWSSHILMTPTGYAEASRGIFSDVTLRVYDNYDLIVVLIPCIVQDCKAIGSAGMVEHQFLSESKGKPQVKRTKKIWKKWFPEEPYTVISTLLFTFS